MRRPTRKSWIWLFLSTTVVIVNFFIFKEANSLLKIYSIGIPATLGLLFFLILRVKELDINFIILIGIGHLIQFILSFLILTPFYYYHQLYIQEDLFEVGPEVILASLLGQVFLFIGYYGNGYRTKISSVFSTELKPKIYNLKGYLFIPLMIYVPIWIARYILFSTGSYYHTVRSDFQFEQSWIYSPLSQIVSLNGFVLVYVFLLYNELKARSKNNLFKIRIFIVIIFLLELVWAIPSGSREGTLIILLIPFIVYYKYNQKIPKKLILALSVLVIFYLTIAKIYQMETFKAGENPYTFNIKSTTELVQKSYNQIEEGSNILGYQFYLPYISRFWDGISLSVLLSRYDSRYEKELGNTYLNMIYLVTPRFIYPDKPASQLVLNDWFPEMIIGGSVPTTFIGESYINFGWAGIILVSLVVGFLIKYFDLFFIKRSHNIIWSALYISLVVAIIRLPVQPIRIWLSTLIYYIIFGFVMAIILNAFIFKKTSIYPIPGINNS